MVYSQHGISCSKLLIIIILTQTFDIEMMIHILLHHHLQKNELVNKVYRYINRKHKI